MMTLVPPKLIILLIILQAKLDDTIALLKKKLIKQRSLAPWFNSQNRVLK